MKIGKYILEILPFNSKDIKLNIPYDNYIWYTQLSFLELPLKYHSYIWRNKVCNHIKCNTGVQYKIIGLYWKLLIIKQLN